jgi:LPXTG-motif cell wall-anchored protein
MGGWGTTRGGAVIALALLAAVTTTGPARASSAPDAGVRWEPPPLTAPLFGIKPPSADPAQVRIVTAADGVTLYTQTWLPTTRAGHVPPAHLPVVVQFTPYATTTAPDDPRIIDLLVPRGYAVTFANVRGSGGSGGCFGLHDQHDVDDGARIIEDAGELAPWASGSVGMTGGSSPGGTQLAVATGPDRDRLESLKAIEVSAPAASLYETYDHDGVPNLLSAPGSLATYVVSLTNPTDRLDRITERLGCQPQQLLEADSLSGNYTPFWAARDHLVHMDRLEAATLMVHGHADRRVSPSMQVGLFDAIPASTPKTGLFGIWGHQPPDLLGSEPGTRADWQRADWQAMQLAWFERYLRGADNGVDDWPVAQVQRTDGQWRTASDWPFVPGPTRTMPLGPGGSLDVAGASGTTTYLEAPAPEVEADALPTDLPGTTAVFSTAPLTEPLELIGRPSVELWVQLLLPDSHVTARLEVVDAAGERLIPEARTAGARSAQHLLPLVHGRMRQTAAIPAPVLQPLLVSVPLDPTDLIAPVGSRLRLTIAGSSIMWDGLDGVTPGLGTVFQGPTLPSGMVQPVTILHDAAHPSALRFTTPEASSSLLDVREKDEGAMPVATVPTSPAPAPTAAPTSPGRHLPATGGSSSPAIVVMALALVVGTLRLRRRPA